MNYVTEDLARYIETHLPDAGKVDEDIFYDYTPKDQDNIIVFNEYPGTGVANFTHTSVRMIQCMIRNKSNIQARNIAWDVYDSLKPEDPFIHLGKVIAIQSLHDTPFRLSSDDKGRSIWVFNMALTYNYK